MSRDIRSFFSIGAKAASSSAKAPLTPSSTKKRKPTVLDDSDEEITTSNKFEKGESSKTKDEKSKKRRIIESSDEDEPKSTNDKVEAISSKLSKLSSKTSDSKKMKPVDISNVFGDGPVKRVEKEKKPKKSNKDIFDEDTDEMDVDEDVVSQSANKTNGIKKEKPEENSTKVKDEPKTPKKESGVLKAKDNIKTPPKFKAEKKSPVKPKTEEKIKERKHTPDDKVETPKQKKQKGTPASSKRQKKHDDDDDAELDRSVYDPDQEKHEKRRAAAILYKQMQNRSGPANPGSKEIPKGKPNCLANLKFVLTGVFDSMERDEAASVIKELGGAVTSAISGKTNYVVAGEESGPAKLAKAEDMNIPVLTEDDLLDLIREKSGIATLKKKKTEVKKESPVKKNDKSPLKHNSPKKIKIEKDVDETSEAASKPKPTLQPEKEISMAWVDKYKPKTIKDIIGQQGPNSNCAKLIKWLSNWHKNHTGKKAKQQRPNPWAKNDDGSFFKAALLSGPPGVGKTTTAQLVCEHLGFDTIEFNASDTRSKKLLQTEVGELLKNKTLHGYFNGRNTSLTEKQVLIMDEVDGMAGNEDRGGMQELIALIKMSSVPIICMCNDRNHPKIRSLVNHCFDLRYGRPQAGQIKGAIMSILFKEKVKIPPNTIDEIIQATNNDVRQTLNSLSLIAAKPEVATSRGENGKKDLRLGPWEVVRKVFSAEEHKHMTLNDKSDLFFNDYSMGPLFVQQNYLIVSPNGPKSKAIEQVALTADSLSLGDLVESRIRSRNAWAMLPVQAMYSSVLPGEYMAGTITGQINFPAWLGKYSNANKRSRLAQEIHDHTRIRTSASRQSIRLDYAPFLLQNIVHPLIEDQNDGIEESLNVIKEYRLLREDIDSLVELTKWPGKKSPMEQVDGRVKAALTRAYNKEVAPYTYSAVTETKKKKSAAANDDYMNEYDEDGGNLPSDDSEDDDKVENDALIKAKKPSGSRAGSSTSSSSRSTSSTTKRAGTSKKK